MNELLQTLNQRPIGEIVTFLLGLIWGSFFNVCILRIPDEKSLIPGSHCPKCKRAIPFYLNVPVLSYLLLRGRCRNCKKAISIQYPLVELVTAGMFLGLFHQYGFGLQWLGFTAFCSLLLVISVIDLYHQIIPDELSLPGIVIGFLFTWLTGELAWWDSLGGLLAGGGVFLAIAFLYEKLAGREGLGGGDVKLLAMIGAWLGLRSILVVIIISCSLGSVIGIGVMWFRGRDLKYAIPFGPFLAVGAIVYLLMGNQINWLLFPELP